MLANLFCPFTWWAKHDQQFPNIRHLVRQVMDIGGSQIETKFFFNMVGIIIGLKCCQLGIENLDKLILIIKNWLDDLRFGCTNAKPTSIEKYIGIENGMVSKNEELISDFNLFEKD